MDQHPKLFPELLFRVHRGLGNWFFLSFLNRLNFLSRFNFLSWLGFLNHLNWLGSFLNNRCFYNFHNFCKLLILNGFCWSRFGNGLFCCGFNHFCDSLNGFRFVDGGSVFLD